jgi:hypothetical protein
MEKWGKWLATGLVVSAILMLLLLAGTLISDYRYMRRETAESTPQTEEESLVARGVLAEVAAFLATHPEYGEVRRASMLPDWARGRRQRLETSEGSFVFYTEGTAVVTVYEETAAGRHEVWSRDEQGGR